MSRQFLHKLNNIITSLNDPEPGKAKHAGQQQHPPHQCRPRGANSPCYTQTDRKDEIRRLLAQHLPSQAHRSLPDYTPATAPCASASKS